MKSFLTAGFALATCAAWAVVIENFDNMTADETIATGSNFAGGTVEAVTSEPGNNVLAFDGTVTCDNASGASASEFAKTTFKVLAPADGTEVSALPTGDEVSGCQIAVATGPVASDNTSLLTVYVYAIADGASSASWLATSATVTKEAWFTATLSFDYSGTTKTATLLIDGENAGTYTLATAPASSTISSTALISSLAFVGSSKLDEVKIDEAIAKSVLPSNLNGLQIYASELPDDVTADTLAGNSGDNNYAKRIEAGLAVSSDAVAFTATSLAATTSGNTVISVPCVKDYGQVYQIAITDASNKAIEGSPVSATASAISGNQRTLTFTVPSTSEKVLKFQVQAKAPSAS